jgi:hypothetical protein
MKMGFPFPLYPPSIMLRVKGLAFCLLAIIVLASCGTKKGINSTGNASEILVVIDSATMQSLVGDTIRSLFMHTQDGFSNLEASFLLRYMNESDFDEATNLHHNILIVDIDADNIKGRIETLKDEWAHPQRVVKIKSASDTAFYTLLSKHADAINELFEQNERVIAKVKNTKVRNREAEELLNHELEIKMLVPGEMQQTVKPNHSICLESKTAANGLKLIIYAFPYKDSSQLNADALHTLRKLHFQDYPMGSKLDAPNFKCLDSIPSTSNKFVFKGLYALETRGIYKLEGNKTEIPFISYAIIDAPRQRVVVFDGYVNTKEESKRGSIRLLESLILESEFTFPKVSR